MGPKGTQRIAQHQVVGETKESRRKPTTIARNPYSFGYIAKSMADQPPPPYPGTDPEKTQLAGGGPPAAPPPDTQGDFTAAYTPQYPASSPYPPQPDAQRQPPQPTPYPYPAQPYPPAGQTTYAAATGYPASAPPSSAPAVS